MMIIKFIVTPLFNQNLTSFINFFSVERVYSFPVFTENFCEYFLEELDNLEKSDVPKGRPNTMNKQGVSVGITKATWKQERGY